MARRTVYVRCRFTRGGFAHERVFWIKTPDGNGEYRGLAFIGYCFKRNKKQLPDGEPPPGDTIEGFVVARLLREDAGIVTSQVPDGELCDLSPSVIEEYEDVPVGS